MNIHTAPYHCYGCKKFTGKQRHMISLKEFFISERHNTSKKCLMYGKIHILQKRRSYLNHERSFCGYPLVHIHYFFLLSSVHHSCQQNSNFSLENNFYNTFLHCSRSFQKLTKKKIKHAKDLLEEGLRKSKENFQIAISWHL